MHHLLSLAAPLLAPPSGLLRPRLGRFPLILLLLCALWAFLLGYAFPQRRRTLMALVGAGSLLLLLIWLPRITTDPGLRALTMHPGYQHILPLATVVQVTMLLSLVSAPLWVPLARRARRGEAPAAAPAVTVEAPAAEPAVAGAADLAAVAQAAPVEPAGIVPVRGPLILTSRRRALHTLAAGVPAGALVAAGYGSLIEAPRLVLRRVRIAIPGLPEALRGLRIGQITDAHIAPDLTPIAQLERGCELLAGERLDLMVSTGDLCDSPRLFPDVVRLISQVPARLGRFACLGNHELYLDLRMVYRAYERSDTELLAESLTRKGPLTIAGLSYPHAGSMRMSRARIPAMLDAALRERAAETVTLMLSHHPHVFAQAEGRGIGLMLSGHTHGGQLGIGERSLMEPFYGYVRGRYQAQDGAQLFVGSGLGHWLPWRVNCPPEVVVIELV